HPSNLQNPCHRYGEQASRDPKRNQSEFARVVAAHDRDVAQRAFHVSRRDIEHALSSLDRVYFSLRGAAHFRGEHFERCLCPLFIELKFATEQRNARKVTEHYMRIGDRWQQGLAVAGRTRISAGRFWAYT